jgi:hypothetical protein
VPSHLITEAVAATNSKELEEDIRTLIRWPWFAPAQPSLQPKHQALMLTTVSLRHLTSSISIVAAPPPGRLHGVVTAGRPLHPVNASDGNQSGRDVEREQEQIN